MNKTTYQTRALLLGITVVIIAIASLLCIVLHTSSGEVIADIYQNGDLLDSIPLSSVEESYSFVVEGDNGACNEIEVRPGSIGIVSANCPDKLCVHQGFISNSLLPVTCLPNRLVIKVRVENSPLSNKDDVITPDIITY